MFDIAPTELLLCALVALVVIGPKDLPKAMRVLGYWVGRARSVARQFRAGFDEMIREAELAEMEKKWKEENERIMRLHPSDSSANTPDYPHPVPAETATDGEDAPPVMVEKPVVAPPPAPADEAHPPVESKPAS